MALTLSVVLCLFLLWITCLPALAQAPSKEYIYVGGRLLAIESPSDGTAPTVPTNLAATAVSSSQINLSWTASSDNVAVTGYKIFRNGTQVETSTTTTYQDTGLAASTTYSYTVSAYDAAGNNSAQCTAVQATTQSSSDTSPPTVPTNLTATAVSSSQINLSWTASSDNVAVTGYKVFRNGTQVGTSATTAYQDAELIPSTTYSYTVSAYDAAGNNSTQSGPASATTWNSSFVVSLAVNGTNAYVNVPNSTSINITGPITVEAWMKTGLAAATQSAIERYGLYDGGYEIRLVSGKARFYVFTSSLQSSYVEAPTAINDNQWHHVAGIYDGVQLKIYIDGWLAASVAAGNGPASGSADLKIGAGIDSKGLTANWLDGLIDEVRVTAAVVYTSNFMPSASLTALTDTRGLWKFDYQNVNDSSSYGNNGTAQGTNFSADVPSLPAPTVTVISPTSGTTNGGTSVTISGTGFHPGATLSIGAAAGNVVVASATSMTATTAANTAGTFDVSVVNADSQSGTLTSGYTYVAPLPNITPPLVPDSGVQGQAVSLTVNGSNLSGATSVNFSPATGITVSGITSDSTHVWATVTIDATATTGSRTVSVTTPNGTGGSATFTVNLPNPAPTITTISPTSVLSGDGAFMLTVNGTNFISGSQVQVGGANRTTTYVNGAPLTAQITAADVANAGTQAVTVVNPPPGGGVSNSATLTVNANPIPTIATISPTNVSAGSSTFNLNVNGSNYVRNSVVRVNGSNRTTTYVSGTQLLAQIPSSDVAAPGTLSITVFNTTPGGGTSSPATLTVNASNYSLSLNGSTNTYAATAGSSLAISGPVTVEAWMKTTSLAFQEVVRKYSVWGSGGYELYLANGNPYFWIRTTPSYYSVYVYGTTPVNDGAWHHVVGVFDGSTLKLFVDGNLCGTTYSSITYTSDNSALAIGINLDYNMYLFSGLIDEVRVTASAVYSVNFTPNHHLTSITNTKGLWKFDGMSSLDSSGNGANLTLYGNTTYSTDTP